MTPDIDTFEVTIDATVHDAVLDGNADPLDALAIILSYQQQVRQTAIDTHGKPAVVDTERAIDRGMGYRALRQQRRLGVDG